VKAVILAAGIGSRLGREYPKPLTLLASGITILQHQLENLMKYFSEDDIYIVIGYKKDCIMKAFPNLGFVYNNSFKTTNTAKSLLRSLRKVKGHDVIWMNGDVVFDQRVISRIIDCNASCMAVNKTSVDEEEVKYLLSSEGTISAVSKVVQKPLGEALGINKVVAPDLPLLLEKLEQCNSYDYFERGIELSIQEGLRIYPVDVSDLMCVEIDFPNDLKKANKLILEHGYLRGINAGR